MNPNKSRLDYISPSLVERIASESPFPLTDFPSPLEIADLKCRQGEVCTSINRVHDRPAGDVSYWIIDGCEVLEI